MVRHRTTLNTPPWETESDLCLHIGETSSHNSTIVQEQHPPSELQAADWIIWI